MSYGLQQCSNGYRVTMPPLSVNDDVRAGAHAPRSALHGDLQTHLQVQHITSALQTALIRVTV